MAGEWTLPGIGDDLMSSAKFGERRLKVESSIVSGGEAVAACNPIPTNGDSVYRKDIWVEESNLYNFSGSVFDLFCDLHSTIVDSTANTTKSLFIHFNKTVVSNIIGLGSYSGNFSNVKLELYNSGGVATTVINESANNTKYTSRRFPLPITEGFNAVKFTFSTTDTVTLSNCVILKTHGVVARLQAAKPDNTVTDIHATAGGNLKVSLEEYENTFLTDPLPVRIIDSRTGRESEIDVITFGLVTIDVAHHELHEGNHFFVKNWVDIPSAGTADLLYVSGSAEPHMRTSFEGTSAFQVDIYEGATTSNNGTAITVQNRKRSSLNTCACMIYSAPTVTATGTVFVRYKIGAGKTGGSSTAENEIILKPNTKYLIRLTSNVTGATNTIDYLADWYEHTE